MGKRFLAAALLAIGTPGAAIAQQPPAPTQAPEAAAPIDPERLALARTTAAALMPEGSYERMMHSSLEQMVDATMDQMLDMRMSDIMGAAGQGDPSAEAVIGKMTMRELAAEADPHFEERTRITNRVLFQEMKPIITGLEPDLREGLARAYARRFTAEQLKDMNRYFATPTGRVFATESMMMWVDPEIAAKMGALMPALMKEMPSIMEKLKTATAHLPPPPKRTAPREAPEPTPVS